VAHYLHKSWLDDEHDDRGRELVLNESEHGDIFTCQSCGQYWDGMEHKSCPSCGGYLG